MKFVIRGLSLSIDIRTELLEQGYAVRNVTQMTMPTKEKTLLPLIAVTMAKSSSAKKITDIHLIYHKV